VLQFGICHRLRRPHLYQAYLDAERRRHPVPGSIPGRRNCGAWSLPGTPTPRSPHQLDVAEGTVRIHLGNVYKRLSVSGRTAAVTHVFPGLTAT